MDINELAQRLGDGCYILLALNFFWGLYCIIMAFRKLGQLRFRSRARQATFLNELLERLSARDYEGAEELCEGDRRALPRLAHLAIANRTIGLEPQRQVVMESLQQDVMAEMDYRTGWIATTIKSGPLLGLFGTVLGMMAAFGRIGTGEKVETTQIADEIAIALICTAMGLATAIPFNFFLAGINVRLRRMQESLNVGMLRVLEHFKSAARA